MSNTQQFATPERAQAAALKARATEKITAIRASKDLTPEARDRQVAGLATGLRDDLRGLRAAERDRLGAEYDKNRRKVFAPLRLGWRADPAAAVGVRDALDRAAALKTPAEAAELLDRSLQTGDSVLAAAVAQRADEQSGVAGEIPGQAAAWNEVLRRYVQAHPELADVVQELARIEDLLEPAPGFLDEFVPAPVPELRRVAPGTASVGGGQPASV